MPFAATWIQLEIITLSEVIKIKTNTVQYYLYVQSKIQHKWTYLWDRIRNTENRLVAVRGKRDGRGLSWDFVLANFVLYIPICKLIYIECIENKALLYYTGKYTQHPVINHNGKNMQNNVYTCITKSLFYKQWLIQHCNSTIIQ